MGLANLGQYASDKRTFPLLAVKVNLERIVAMIEIMAEQSRFPCFVASDKVSLPSISSQAFSSNLSVPSNPDLSSSHLLTRLGDD